MYSNLVTSLTDLGLDLRSDECKRAKSSAAITSQSLKIIWLEFGILWSHVRVINLILILLVHAVFNIGLYSDICRPISFTLDMMIGITQPYF